MPWQTIVESQRAPHVATNLGNYEAARAAFSWAKARLELSGLPDGKGLNIDILGHSATSMTGDYTHASPEEIERAMESVAAYKGQSFFNLGKISANQETRADELSAVAL